MTLVADPQTDSLRQKTMELARRHKASWIELGRHLYTVHKDKHFKAWGFLSFETYCQKELGIKQQTAAKLLKSYYFLEREEPRYVEPKFPETEAPKKIPDYESVNLLRLARENKKLTPQDFAQIRDSVLSAGKEPKEVRSQVKKILETRNPQEAEEQQAAKRNAALKRLITLLHHAKTDLGKEKLLPAYLLKQMADLEEKLRDQIE